MGTYGVINEQGFAVSNGLGFTPISESDKSKDDNKNKEDKK